MTEKGCDNCYYTYFDERAYPCSLCIRGIERTDMWQPSKKTKADRKTEPSFKVDGIGDNDQTIHAIAHLQKVGWLQEHDRALTEPNSSEKPNNCEPQMEQPYINIETGILHWCGWKYRRIYEDEPQPDCSWKKGE